MPYAGHGASATMKTKTPRGRRRKSDDMPKGRPRQHPYRESARAKALPDATRERIRRMSEYLLQARRNSSLYVREIAARAATYTPAIGIKTVNLYLNPEAVVAQGDVSAVRLWAVAQALGVDMEEMERFIGGKTSAMSADEVAILQVMRLLPNEEDRQLLLGMGRQMVRQRQLAGVEPSASMSKPPTKAEALAAIRRAADESRSDSSEADSEDK
jgi:hypothetical protein